MIPLLPPEIHEIAEAVCRAYPKETAGFVFIRDGANARRELLFCENASKDPEQFFQMFPWDIAIVTRELHLGYGGVFWHSHPNGSAQLSLLDRHAMPEWHHHRLQLLVVQVAPVLGRLVASFHLHPGRQN